MKPTSLKVRSEQTVRMAVPGRGFTLVEMLVAIGAVALIGVGVAQLFSNAGKTVKIGKRISTLNEAASTLERQLRQDISTMTRDGFLVIRHKFANPGGPSSGFVQPIALANTDEGFINFRQRRVDELMFFSRGSFNSARQPLHPNRSASSSVARIYYGHGVRRSPGDPQFASPSLNADRGSASSNSAGQWASGLGEFGPNQFAGRWMLLRNVAILAPQQPSISRSQAPRDWPNPQTWPDSTVQVALQPAASSLFRSDVEGYGFAYPSRNAPVGSPIVDLLGIEPFQKSLPPVWARGTASDTWPRLTSGLVDIVATDLDTVRTRVLGSALTSEVTGQYLASPDFVRGTLPLVPFDENEPRTNVPRSDQSLTRIRMPVDTADNLLKVSHPVYNQKRLMVSAMPTFDGQFFGNNGDGINVNHLQPALAQFEDGNTDGDFRMVFADAPPDFTGSAYQPTPFGANDDPLRDDQLMLTASNLLAGVSEFIVEWSFGEVFPANPQFPGDRRTGQIIWHGIPRRGSFGFPDFFSPLDVHPYLASNDISSLDPRPGARRSEWGADRHTVSITLPSGQTQDYFPPLGLIHWPADAGLPPSSLIGGSGGFWNETLPLYSFFGYVDPTFVPAGLAQQKDNVVPVPWVWPKLIRVTVSLTDPNDPTVEQTYQWVFDVPARTNQN